MAIACAFSLATRMSPRSLQLTWLTMAGLPVLLIAAKLVGLYDRDEALLRKTTLDEVPKLFHLTTLCALAALLVDGLIAGGTLKLNGLLLFWVALTVFMIATRTAARSFALAISPPSDAC